MRRARAAAAAVLGILLAGCATVRIYETRVVMGQVTDESRQPVADTPVVIVARSLAFAEVRMQYVEQGRQEVKGTTDAQGRYRIEFFPGTVGNNFYLFFYDKTGFDGVKYRRPEPVDITPLLKGGREIFRNQVLQRQVTWPELERQIAFYGPESKQGEILRKHGLPEKREASGAGDAVSEVWWYYADGVSYWFTGGTLTRTYEFTPIPGAAPAK